jgi:hypothetical protein
MYQIDGSTAAVTEPTPAAPGPNPGGFFTNGSPGVTPATIVDQDWLNAVQQEICNVITAASLTLSKTNQGQLLQAIQTLGRIRLTASLNLYVATTGNDANPGTSGSPFLTLQAATNAAANLYDTNGFGITVHVADGTYTAGVIISRALVGGGALNFVGDTATPTNCVISATNSSCFYVAAGQSNIQGFKLQATGTATAVQGNGFLVSGSGNVSFNSIVFGLCAGSHMVADSGGNINAASIAYSINAGAGSHIVCNQGFVNIVTAAVTILLASTFSQAFAGASIGGAIQALSMTFSGAAVTGTRYTAATNGVIFTNGGGANYFPGSTAGATATGGQYA